MTVRERYSAALTKLVILVYKEYNYPQKISQHIRVTQSPVSRQLKQVEKDGYIEGKKENLLYKTVYELNWYNLISLFYENLTQNISFNLKKQAEKEKVSVEKLIESLKENKEIDLRNYKEEIERISKDNKCNQAVHKIIETSFEVSFETNFDISLDDLYGLIYFAIISFRKNPFTGAWDKSIYRLTETEKEKRGKDVTYQIDTLHGENVVVKEEFRVLDKIYIFCCFGAYYEIPFSIDFMKFQSNLSKKLAELIWQKV